MDIGQALQSLRPRAEWVLRGDELEWLDKKQTQPTQAEIDAEIIRLEAEYQATQYQRDRKPEYPDVGDQLDAVLKYVNLQRMAGNDMPEDLDQILAQWLSVKQKYPK